LANFIPKPYSKEPITIRIEAEKIAKLDILANRYDMSRSEFICHCIDFAVSHIAGFTHWEDITNQ
jgi:predicted transcriptional regulator